MRLTTCLFLVLVSLSCKERSTTSADIINVKEDSSYKRSVQYDTSQLRQVFPFGKAMQVQLVSYNSENDLASILITTPPGKIIMRKWDEAVLLDDAAKLELSDILYNYSCKSDMLVADCYNPRNAILFLDDKKRALAAIEICFECSRYMKAPKDMDIGEFCPEKMEMLRVFLEKKGIKKGIESHEPSIPPATK